MKPIECKTYLEQALKNGHGISWLDDCRIPYETGEDIREGNMEESKPANIPAGCAGGTIKSGTGNPQGRFPANLLVSLDSLNDFKIHKGQQGSTTGKEPSVDKNGNCYGDYSGVSNPHIALGDKGSYSRYFDLDKWAEGKNIYETQFMITPKASKSEKNKGCDEGVEKDIGHNRFDKCETCGKYILQNQDRPSACKCENPIRKNNVISGNFHPTVKPVKLMSYLITMFSREGDVIVDPFCGSGTTGVASKKLKRNFIGIDITPEYIEIAKTRINAEGKENIEAVINKTVDDKGNVKEIIRKYEQPRLFDESK
jgi:site-specific DNA-methyltransferase (adenine-specific)